VQCADHVTLDNGAQEYLIAGLDDGTIQILDYTKHKGTPGIQRPVFKVQRNPGAAAEERPADLDHPYDYFQESIYEHSATVTAIERHFKDQTVFASAGRDGKVFIWQLSGIHGHDAVELITEIEKGSLNKGNSQGAITSLKWFDENTVAFSMTNGSLQLNDIRIKQKSEATPKLASQCSLVYKTEEGPIWDTALWRSPAGTFFVCAEDSGKVTLVDPRKIDQAPTLLHVSSIKI